MCLWDKSMYMSSSGLEEVWARGRRHAKISKLYLKSLLKRGPNIFVALAWSQVSCSCDLVPSNVSCSCTLLYPDAAT